MNNIDYSYKSKKNTLFECGFCKKTYKNKINYDKHYLICELLHDKDSNVFYCLDQFNVDSNPKLERNSSININNNSLLIELMKTLIKRYNKLSDEMIEIKKWIHKEKKQLNIIDWLNNSDNNFIPNISFDDYINNFTFPEEYIKKIIHNNIQDVYLSYIDDEFEDISVCITDLDSETKITLPICCFNQKPNTFYIYTDIEILKNSGDSNAKMLIKNKLSSYYWREATKEDLIKLFGKIKNKFISELCNWYEYQQNQQNYQNEQNQQYKIEEKKPNILQYQYNSYQYNSKSKEKLDEIFNKSVLKLMTDISNNNLFQKLKNKLYNKLKIDIKQYIEYDFNFTSNSS
jgi:hypothetical protein